MNALRRYTILLALTLWAGAAWAQNVSGVWYDPAKSGQGVTLAFKGGHLDGVWYYYDATHEGRWVVFSGELRGGSMTAELYAYTGPPLDENWDQAQVQALQVGSVQLHVHGTHTIQFDYVLNGISGTLNLVPFDLPVSSVDLSGFTGAYLGSYDGTESGHFTVIIDDYGHVEMVIVSDTSRTTFSAEGNISVNAAGQVEFSASSSVPEMAFTGVIDPDGHLHGSWTGADDQGGTFAGDSQNP